MSNITTRTNEARITPGNLHESASGPTVTASDEYPTPKEQNQ
jgi:hypothetical protein